MWFPGAGFRRKASVWADTLFEMVEQPHNFVKNQMVCLTRARKKLQFTSRCKAAGTATHSFSSALLEGQKLTADEEFDLKWSAASLYSGAWALPSCVV